jgi:hypothetical protein
MTVQSVSLLLALCGALAATPVSIDIGRDAKSPDPVVSTLTTRASELSLLAPRAKEKAPVPAQLASAARGSKPASVPSALGDAAVATSPSAGSAPSRVRPR